MKGTIGDVIAKRAKCAILEGDCAVRLKEIPDASVDSIVADPPAGIAFMGKVWDTDKGGESEWIAWLAGILAEGYRVLKPGGHCLLWALPRTSDWTMQALRRAGFEVRDVVTHLFGSGFPKSLDVSKAIDSAAGATREVVGPSARHVSGKPEQRTDGLCGSSTFAESIGMGSTITAPATPEARKWSGFGTALKPAAEFWILARKPLDGTVAANVLRHGTGALNIDAARVGTAGGTAKGSFPNESSVSAYGNGLNGACDIVDIGKGRFPANLVLSHTAWDETHCPCGAVLSFVARFCPECGSAAVEHRRAGCCAVGERKIEGHKGYPNGPGGKSMHYASEARSEDVRPNAWQGHADPDGLETVTAWECLATCACGLSTLAPSGGAPPRCRCGRGMAWACPVARLDEQAGDVSDMSADKQASCFFNTFAPPDDMEPFFYQAKPSVAETEAGCEHLPTKRAHENVDREEGSAGMNSPRAGAGRTSGRKNHHPTKKNIKMMRHFCRLITPPGGIVLDMFGGSLTTGCAAALEGMRSILCEMDPEYIAIGEARLAFWAPLAGTQIANAGTPRPVRDKSDPRQVTIFDAIEARQAAVPKAKVKSECSLCGQEGTFGAPCGVCGADVLPASLAVEYADPGAEAQSSSLADSSVFGKCGVCEADGVIGAPCDVCGSTI
jgi:DNA modification methylase